MTDPYLTAWYDANGYEVADKCQTIYGTPLGTVNGQQYNQEIGTGLYDTQLEYSNKLQDCFQVGPPIVTGLSPSSGAPGDEIGISGANFFNSPVGVFFNGVASPSVTIDSPTHITATVPSGSYMGHVRVNALGGSVTSTQTFGAKPVVTSLSETDGFVGDSVTVDGAGFFGVTSVKVGGVTASFNTVAADGTSLKMVIPAAAVSGQVTVTNAFATSTNAVDFTVDPKVTSVSPVSAAGLASVTINGTGLGGATEVDFNGDASPHIVSDIATKVVAQVPVDATNGTVTVTTGAGTSPPSAVVFKPLARVTSITGDPAQVGDTVTVNGYDFTANIGSPTVKLGTAVLVPGSVGATSFTVTVPDGVVTGALSVANGNGTTTATLHVKPTISGAPSPTHGPAGTAVTLAGDAFTGTSHATVGGVSASFSVLDYHHLRVTVPTAGVTGAIVVTNAGGQASSSTFTVDPKIASFSPASGAGGATLTINGTGLGGATSVGFGGGVDAVPSSSTATSVHVTVPADALNGQLTVTTPAGTSAPSTAVFKPLPKVTSITGEPAQVGDTVTVNGDDFTANIGTPTVKLGATVLVPGSVSATSFTLTVPAGGLTGPLSVGNGNGTTTATLHVKPTITGPPSPSDGPAGTVVTLTGQAFKGTTRVTLGGVAASFAVVDYNHLHVTVPAAGVTGAIVVTNAGGQASSSTFTVDPKVASFSPSSAVGGATLTITGTGLGGATSVGFGGGIDAVPTSSMATSVHVTVPDDALDGQLTVTTPAGTSAPSTAVFKPKPRISSISGDPAQVGDTVTVNGGGFTATGVTPTAKLGSTVLAPSSLTATSFMVTIPDGAVTGTLTVSDANGSASSTLHVKPRIDSGPTPSHAQTGTVVALTGKTFTGTSHVTVGGVNASFAVVDYRDLHVTIPATAVSGAIVVTNAGGQATSSTFVVDPNIKSFTPTSGPVGAAVTITGTGLDGATEVDFDGVSATPTSANATSVHVNVPVGAMTGQLTVHTASSSQTATSTASFTVTLSVAAMDKSIAKVGESVHLTGTGFTGVTAVKFNGQTASFTVDDDSHITATVPGNATGTVTVTKGGDTVSAPEQFTILALADISPGSAAPGGVVTITGSGFTGATGVKLSGHTAPYTVDSDTQLTVTVPAGFSGGSGSVVVTADGGSTISGDLTLLAVASDSTNSGAPGDPVALHGSGFTGATDVSFGGESVSYTVDDDGTIETSVPADAAPGDGTFTVTGPGGTAAGPTFTVG